MNETQTAAPPRHRLDGVDGLRAVAALWVLLFHAWSATGARLGPLTLFASSGSIGVSLFLVLSGFCLYLPVVRAGGRLDVRRFLRRRAVRLLPTYYVALAIVVVLTPFAAGKLGLYHYSGAELAAQTASHLTMTQSLFPSTFYGLNGSYWSLALEWQLYLTLPLLVVGIRRFGLARTVFAVVALNVAYRIGVQMAVDTHLIAPNSLMATAVLINLLPGRWAEFAFGMVAASLYESGRAGWVASRLGWGLVPMIAVAIVLHLLGNPLEHLAFGAVFFLLLCVVVTRGNAVSRIFSWRPLSALGVMSYSLYLVHQPLVGAASYLLLAHGSSPRMAFVGTLLMTPVIVAVAWLLFVAVERHTIRSSGTPAPGSPEALLLTPLRLFRSRRTPPDPAAEAA
jgi:peptidoglycan/LPS O-acetylase OafA/YrhL